MPRTGVVHGAIDFDALPMHEVFSETPVSDCCLPGLLGRHDRLISCFAGGDRLAEMRLSAMCQAASASFLPVRPLAGYAGHLLDLWRDLLGLTAGNTQEYWPWRVPRKWRTEAAKQLKESGLGPGGRYVVIHPGAGAEAKRWPLDNYLALAGLLGRVVFMLGPAEVERWKAGHVAAVRGAYATLTCAELEVVAVVLSGASAYVGNDSGVTHLAAALGTPTVALFGAGGARNFAPCGPAVRVLEAKRIESITVEQALQAITDLRR
jgi:ADP-heptose:LPS heptosyltransferase